MSENESPQSQVANTAYAGILDKFRTARIIDIAQWFRDLLHTGRGGPLVARAGRETATDVLMHVYRASEDVRVQYRIRRAVAELLRQAHWQVDSPFYLSELLSIVGYVNATAVRRKIRCLANRGELKRVPMPSAGNLHHHLLNTIVALEDVPGAIAIFKRDIQQPEYASICYQGLWEQRLEYGIDYLPVMLAHQRRNPELVNLPFALESFIAQTEFKSKIDYFAKDLFPAALRLLKERDEVLTFLDCLEAAGYSVELPPDSNVYYFRSSKDETSRLSEDYSQEDLPAVFHVAWMSKSLSKERRLKELFEALSQETEDMYRGQDYELALMVFGRKPAEYLYSRYNIQARREQ